MVTFSRGNRPMRPRRCDSVTLTSGHTLRTIWPARSSSVASSGEKTDAIATARIPASRISPAAAATAEASNGTIDRPSYSCPPRTMKCRA